MPRLKAITSWAGRKAGEEFEANDAEARLLCAPDAIGGQKAKIIDRAMMPVETPAALSVEPENQKQSEPQKRRYLRRDMRAQN